MDLPGWVDVAVIAVCVVLALAVIWMMFSRSRVTAERSPFDPMLLVSAVTVIALAAVAYFLV